uniref:ATP-dependent NAD(P)H-hydrate dehydratase n=1 Tax=Plectus sambesii TaxID=2011161 RepID=A0A914V265_9BILA
MANIPQSKSLHSTEGGKELLKCVQSLFPKLDEKNKKGDCGRIAVIGGSQEYTGAPYFAAISSLKFGADILHVFCPKEAATVIKSYSPELIVHPLLSVGNGDNKWKEIFDWLDRVNAVVIGPGLGRND